MHNAPKALHVPNASYTDQSQCMMHVHTQLQAMHAMLSSVSQT